ncbi:MAG: hypothetical protein C4291_07675 [Candidatus Dadabacteria bacterium]
MENIGSYEKLSQRNRDLEILTRIIQSVHKSYNLEEVYMVILDSVMELENVDMVMVYLIDKQRHEAILQAHRNLPGDYVRRAGRIPCLKGVTWKVINRGELPICP